MSKIKVYELAKELEVSNKEIVDFLKSKNIEVRTHMSAVDEADAEAVRKAFPKGEKAAEKTEAEAPKKKNIVHVFRPQNTQNGGKQGRRPGGNRQNPSQGRPMQVNNGRPAKKPAAAVTAEKPQTEKRPEKSQQKPAEKPRAAGI